MERPAHDPERGSDCECFKCHIRGLTIGLPSDFRSKSTYLSVPPRTPNNSYEKGVPVSRRNGGTVMPYLRADGETMHQVEFDRKRHRIEENRAKLAASSTN